jgi:hypothetical protein
MHQKITKGKYNANRNYIENQIGVEAIVSIVQAAIELSRFPINMQKLSVFTYICLIFSFFII